MAVKVLITRKCKEGMEKEVFALFNQLRSLAMKQPGYISGETLHSAEDSTKFLVVATWHSVDEWVDYRMKPERKAVENKLLEFLEEPSEDEVYVYATYPFK